MSLLTIVPLLLSDHHLKSVVASAYIDFVYLLCLRFLMTSLAHCLIFHSEPIANQRLSSPLEVVATYANPALPSH